MFFGLFGSRGTTDDTIEQLEINQAYTRATLDANSNMMRQARNRFLDDWDDDYLEQINKLRDELRAAQRRIAAVEKENHALKETAVRIAVDRRAICNAIEYLNTKWGIHSPRSNNANNLLFDEAEKKRQEELDRLMSNESYLESVANDVEVFTAKNVKDNKTLLTRKPK